MFVIDISKHSAYATFAIMKTEDADARVAQTA
jgi:hypothetical protein